jgi:hypothetical protein
MHTDYRMIVSGSVEGISLLTDRSRWGCIYDFYNRLPHDPSLLENNP